MMVNLSQVRKVSKRTVIGIPLSPNLHQIGERETWEWVLGTRARIAIPNRELLSRIQLGEQAEGRCRRELVGHES